MYEILNGKGASSGSFVNTSVKEQVREIWIGKFFDTAACKRVFRNQCCTFDVWHEANIHKTKSMTKRLLQKMRTEMRGRKERDVCLQSVILPLWIKLSKHKPEKSENTRYLPQPSFTFSSRIGLDKLFAKWGAIILPDMSAQTWLLKIRTDTCSH